MVKGPTIHSKRVIQLRFPGARPIALVFRRSPFKKEYILSGVSWQAIEGEWRESQIVFQNLTKTIMPIIAGLFRGKMEYTTESGSVAVPYSALVMAYVWLYITEQYDKTKYVDAINKLFEYASTKVKIEDRKKVLDALGVKAPKEAKNYADVAKWLLTNSESPVVKALDAMRATEKWKGGHKAWIEKQIAERMKHVPEYKALTEALEKIGAPLPTVKKVKEEVRYEEDINEDDILAI